MTRRRLAVVAGFAIAAVVALAVGIGVGLRPGTVTAPPTDTLFAVSLPDDAGQQQSLAQWRGKVLIVNFWATWCGPCRDEMPQFVRVQNELGAHGVQFVGIAVDDAVKVRQFARELGLNYPALIGGFGAMELSRVYGNQLMALPFTLVIDRKGRIVHTQLGPLPGDKLRALIGPIL